MNEQLQTNLAEYELPLFAETQFADDDGESESTYPEIANLLGFRSIANILMDAAAAVAIPITASITASLFFGSFSESVTAT